jgi:O-antigen/teichoic acid export membrane protein
MPVRVVIHGRLLARNSLLNLLGAGVPLIVAAFTMPVVIRGLGPGRFGVLAVCWALLAYFSVFDLGLGRAATKFSAEAFGSGDEERVSALTWSALIVQASLGTVGGLALAALAPVLVSHLLRGAPQDVTTEARRSFQLLAVAVPIISVSGSLRGVLEAAQRFDLVNAVRAPVAAASFLVPFLGVLAGWTLPPIVAILVVVSGASAVAQYLLCSSLLPTLSKGPRFRAVEVRRLLGYGGWLTVSGVLGPILTYTDRFMVGVLVSAAAVGFYSAPHEVITRLLFVPASVVATLFPGFSTLNGQGHQTAMATLFARAVKYVLLVLGPVAVLLVLFAHQVLGIWLGSQFAERSTLVLQILTVGLVANSLAQVPYALIQAVGRPDLTAKFHLVEFPIHVLLLWILIDEWGIAGAALAWSARVALDGVLLFAAASRLSGISFRAWGAQKLPQVVFSLALFGLCAAGIATAPANAWLRGVAIGIIVLGASFLTWRYLIGEDDRLQILRVVQVADRE